MLQAVDVDISLDFRGCAGGEYIGEDITTGSEFTCTIHKGENIDGVKLTVHQSEYCDDEYPYKTIDPVHGEHIIPIHNDFPGYVENYDNYAVTVYGCLLYEGFSGGYVFNLKKVPFSYELKKDGDFHFDTYTDVIIHEDEQYLWDTIGIKTAEADYVSIGEPFGIWLTGTTDALIKKITSLECELDGGYKYQLVDSLGWWDYCFDYPSYYTGYSYFGNSCHASAILPASFFSPYQSNEVKCWGTAILLLGPGDHRRGLGASDTRALQDEEEQGSKQEFSLTLTTDQLESDGAVESGLGMAAALAIAGMGMVVL